ncbi:MAG: MFS transporter [Pseudomonadota bacterium]
MMKLLRNRTYRHLLAAQMAALLGSGLATVALGLLAWRIGGPRAGEVLGIALAIKMVAYVTLAPLAEVAARRLPRRAFLIGLDLSRALAVTGLITATQVWHVYLLVFLFQAASAGFTPAFQAVVPDVLPEERDYTRALSLSRLAEDMETLLAPLLAAALLTVVSFPVLFAGTVAGFLLSAALIATVALPPRPTAEASRSVFGDAMVGMRRYLATPRLAGALALEATAAAAGAMVFVNSVVILRERLGLGEDALALALAAFGGGSIVAALILPRALGGLSDRVVMLTGGTLMVVAVGLGAVAGSLGTLMVLWSVAGFGFALTQTPVGRLIARSALPADRPGLYAAQFSLSHACWLVTYPLTGWAGAALGLDAAFALAAGLGGAGLLAAAFLWPPRGDGPLAHDHPDLPLEHPHLQEHAAGSHAHPVLIDALHPVWPRG